MFFRTMWYNPHTKHNLLGLRILRSCESRKNSPAVLAFLRLYRNWILRFGTPNDFFCRVSPKWHSSCMAHAWFMHGSYRPDLAHIRLICEKHTKTPLFTILGKFRHLEPVFDHYGSYLAYFMHGTMHGMTFHATFVPYCHFSCYFGRIPTGTFDHENNVENTWKHAEPGENFPCQMSKRGR